MTKLKDRIENYRQIVDSRIMPKVPIVICINGRNFAKTTQLLDKPFCKDFYECILATMLKLCSNIEGSIFAYQHNDEIVIITKNDQNIDTDPWCDNKIQKICSITSAAATLYFNEAISSLQLNTSGDSLFTSQIFGVPNQSEAINTIIYHQQQNFHTSIQSACLYNLLNKYDKNTIKDMLNGLNIDEKIGLLLQECDINFNDYPLSFKRGAAVYKTQQIVDDNLKNKWIINDALPIFTKDQSFLTNIFRF